MDLTLETILSRNPEILHAEAGPEALVMLSVDGGMYYSVNGVGARVWTLLEQPRAVRAIIDALASEFDVELDTCISDTEKFLRGLMDKGIVRVVDA